MNYFIFKNLLADDQLEKMEKGHQEAESRKDDFEKIIINLVSEVKKDPATINKLIYPIVNSANKIVYSFKEFSSAKKSEIFKINEAGEFEELKNDVDNKESTMVLVFLVNAKAFLDCAQKFLKNNFDENDKELLRSVTLLRNYIVHFYDIKINKNVFLGDLSFERGLRDYSVYSLAAPNNYYEVYFSLPILYFSIKDVFEKILKKIKKFSPKWGRG